MQQDDSKNEIAIIGMACLFPGAKNYLEFWKNLQEGINSIQKIPSCRWENDTYYNPNITSANTINTQWAGLIEDIKSFDHAFFKISPQEALAIDPQSRLFLQETWHCLEDAAVTPSYLQQHSTSVYFGVSAIDYFQMAAREKNINAYTCTGVYPCMGAHRISHFFGLSGASFSIDAACASSFVALHEAKLSLRSGDCDYAIIGGANVICHPWHQISLAKCRVLSPDGQCKTFDKSANGYVRSEGVAVFLLTTKKRAINEKHPIYALLKGSAINHCGATRSISTPKAQSQEEVIKSALKDACIPPKDIDYVETHGTGTVLGDAIEFSALNRVFRHKLALGSVKANIGHLEAASGFAGLAKVILMMKFGKVPKQINLSDLNPMLDFSESNAHIPSKTYPWVPKGEKRKAGITSLGFGGVNTHFVVEEYITPASAPPSFNSTPILFSAKTEKSLDQLIENWQYFCSEKDFEDLKLNDISYTLLKGREHFPFRAGIVCHDKTELNLSLSSLKINNSSNQKYALFCGALNSFDLVSLTSTCSFALSDAENRLISSFCNHSNNPQNLAIFLATYCIGKFILKVAKAPALILSEGLGQWAAIALSDGISLDAAITALLGKKESIQGFRPSIPMLDNNTNEIVQPFGIDEEYCKVFAQGLSKINEIEIPVLQKVQDLYEQQFTLKKNLEAMDVHLKKYKISVLEAIANPYLYQDQKKEAMINLTLYVSLDYLYGKYHITHSLRSQHKALNALRQFILVGKMRFADALQIIHRPFEHQSLLCSASERTVPYSYTVKEGSPLPNYNGQILSIGSNRNLGMNQTSIIGQDLIFEEILNALTSMWLNGVDIDWSLFASTFFKTSTPVGLPTYSFEPTPLWTKLGVQI